MLFLKARAKVQSCGTFLLFFTQLNFNIFDFLKWKRCFCWCCLTITPVSTKILLASLWFNLILNNWINFQGNTLIYADVVKHILWGISSAVDRRNEGRSKTADKHDRVEKEGNINCDFPFAVSRIFSFSLKSFLKRFHPTITLKIGMQRS